MTASKHPRSHNSPVLAERKTRGIFAEHEEMKAVKEDISGDESTNTHHESLEKSTEDGNNEKDLRDAIIQKEEGMVRRAKVLVFCAIVMCTAVVSTCVYIFASQNDEHNFEIEVNTRYRSLVLW